MLVGDGKSTDFLFDAWCVCVCLHEKFPNIFYIYYHQHLTVAKAADMNWNFSFKRWMGLDIIQVQWRQLRNILNAVALNNEQDKLRWKYTKLVFSLYNKLSAVGVDRSFKQLWISKIPLKVKIWLCLIWHNAVATRIILRKESGNATSFVDFVVPYETINYLFFTCLAVDYM
jgi:hypothetical protein